MVKLVTIERAQLRSCDYCGAEKGQPCQIVLVPGLQVSVEWAHRAREQSAAA
jgi:hypothetical protein